MQLLYFSRESWGKFMKIKNVEIDNNTIIDLGVIGVDAALDICATKLLKEIIKVIPKPTKAIDKLIFKIGEFGLSLAAGAGISYVTNSAGEKVKELRNKIKQAKEVASDGYEQPQTELE